MGPQMSIDVASWLQQLGLAQYEPAFRDNQVDGDVLPDLTADDLVAIGVTAVGHRRAQRRGASPCPDSDTGIGAAACTGASPGRAAPADRDVLRPGGVDGALQ